MQSRLGPNDGPGPNDRSGLNDRIHARILASGRTWTADEMGYEFLRLSGGPAGALVRAMLRSDARFFEEMPGTWTARRAVALPLRTRDLAVAWVETGGRNRPETWRVHLRPVGNAAGGVLPGRVDALRPADPAAWDDAFRSLGNRRLATMQPGPLGRVRQWMGRHWALGGDEDPVLDLHALARLALVREGVPPGESGAAARLPQLFVRWGLGPVREEPEGVPLPAVELLLERLLERFGDATEEDLTRQMDEALSPRSVPTEGFEFSLGDIDSVVEGSGIYRFIGDGGSLLYVGKAVALRRRLASYFRPLPPEMTKREELLRAIRRFEVTPLPSELEALLRESRAIREHRPPWNVQVEVHELETLPPGWWWPLVFLAPGIDPGLASAFLLTGPSDGYLFHLPRAAADAPDATLAAWLDGIINVEAQDKDPARGESAAGIFPEEGGGPPEAARQAGVFPLDAAEVRLAVRFFLRERDRLDRVDAADLTDGLALAEALHRMAAAPSGV